MKLVPIRLSVIKPSPERTFDIYTIEDSRPLLILSKNLPLRKKSMLFKSYSKSIVYVPDTQINDYRRFISNNIDYVLEDETISDEYKTYAVYISFTEQLEKLINQGDMEIAHSLQQSIPKFVAKLLNNKTSISIFLDFIKEDADNIATHMFNVGTYATMLTKMIHPDLSQSHLEKISQGYFMHDIGMMKINKDILRKKEKYTEQEYEEIKKHPQYGVEILKDEMGINNKDVLSIILEHHERKDGSGYPLGKTDINEFARICSMCDIFDAITSKREYKDTKPQTTFEALQKNQDFFIEEFGKKYYEAFVLCFKPL
jgi:HD-GYP domain-containing protein (c-di-GMP phosphodiesterase class II)